MVNLINAHTAPKVRYRTGRPMLTHLAACCCVFTLAACSDSKDAKPKETTSATAPAGVAKPDSPAVENVGSKPTGTPTQESKPEATSKTLKSEPLDKAAVPATSTVAKANLPEPDAKTKPSAGNAALPAKDSSPALASKPTESAPPAPKKEEIAATKETAPLSLKMNIIGQRKEADGSYTELAVSEGSVLRSRDNFQIHFQVNRPAHVYILMYDSQGKAGQIYPDTKAGQTASVQANRKLVLPSKDLWFWLDDNTGTESIYVLASEEPMTDIGGLLSKMEGNNESGQQIVSRQIRDKIKLMQRGVGGITKGDTVTYTLSDGKQIQKVTDVVTGTGSVVRAVSFQHR